MNYFNNKIGDAVADGGALPFNHFDLFEGVSRDQLEKVQFAWTLY